jgi:type I restriction enzyme S subunit
MKTGWERKKLGQLLAVLRNGVNCKQDRKGQGYKISRIESIADATFDIGRVGYGTLNDREKERFRLQRGDILFSHINSAVHVGKTAVFDCNEEVYHGMNLLLMRPTSEVIPNYLELALKFLFQSGYWRGVCKQSVNQASVNQRDISRVEICFPTSLPEQRRIVGILDEAFAGLATAEANAARNLQNAREIFDSHLHAVFSQRGEGWDRVTLETLLERRWIESHLDGNHGSDYPRKEEFISEGTPYISANCIEDDRVDMTKAKFLAPERAALLRKGIARNNDILFAHNATVGPVAILYTREPKVILGTSLTYYRCNPSHIIPEYLAHYMRSSQFTSQYSEVMQQSTRNQVPITKQREFFHIIPPLDEQKRLIHALEGLFDSAQKMTWLYEQKQIALVALKKALLHRAFSGELYQQ